MLEAPATESSAHLRHEFRTPVNHIIGYSELLIEDAGQRHLESLVPVFEGIQKGGRELLESIQSAFGGQPGRDRGSDSEAFKTQLGAAATKITAILTSLTDDLESSHRQTIADLDAISWATRRLLDMVGQERATAESPRAGLLQRARLSQGAEEVPGELALERAKRGGGRILVADDDAANRNLLRRRLDCEGHEVVEATNGLEVLDALKDSPCDLVLLDIIMPAMDGFETLAKMKADAGLRELPVIMITALDELESVVRCIEMGAEDYLTKPFNRVLLRARIGASLEKKWLRDRERHKTEELERTLQLLEHTQEQLHVLASRDALTELANRRSVEAQLDLLIKREKPFTAIYIDLNGFKRINDTYGHAAGDEMLRQVGRRLRLAFRSTDFIGRWGGDEFVALVDPTFADVQTSSLRISQCLADDFAICQGETEHRVSIGAAIGVATWKPGDTATEVLHRADFAMYEEKLRSADAAMRSLRT